MASNPDSFDMHHLVDQIMHGKLDGKSLPQMGPQQDELLREHLIDMIASARDGGRRQHDTEIIKSIGKRIMESLDHLESIDSMSLDEKGSGAGMTDGSKPEVAEDMVVESPAKKRDFDMMDPTAFEHIIQGRKKLALDGHSKLESSKNWPERCS